MGKHDIATPINETLEKHYQDEIKRLKAKISELESTLNEASVKIEQLHFTIELGKAEIETLRNALIDTMIEKTEAKHVK